MCLATLTTGYGRLFDAEGQIASSLADVAKCGSSLDAKSARPLPRGLPVLPHTRAYEYIVDGSTQFWFATVPGSSNTIVDVRDGIKKALAVTGHVEIAQDQELGAEADYYFAGRYIGSVQVRPLCDGRLRVRYGFAPDRSERPPFVTKGRPSWLFTALL